MNIIIAVYCYIATVVGAGFASGQEILSFFVRYGKAGIFGIILSGIFFGGYAFVIINGCQNAHAKNYNTLLKKTLSPLWCKIAKIITFVFLCAVYCAMVSCMGEMTRLLFGIEPVWGRLILSISAFIFAIIGNSFSFKSNGILGIIIVVGMISCLIYMLQFREHQTFLQEIRASVSGAAYSGYNLLGAGVILAISTEDIKTKKEALSVGLFSGIILFILMLLMWGLLSLYYKHINLGEIPLLTMAFRQNKVICTIYSLMLLLSVMTTAISSVIGIISMTKEHINTKNTALLVVVGGIFAGAFGFSNIINIVYRICGYIGVIVILVTVVSIIKNQRKQTKNQDKCSISKKIS